MAVAHVFADRAAAGAELARELRCRMPRLPPIVLGLARGGVAVARPVAAALHAPLDVMVVRKIGLPGQPELAIGAIAPGGIIVREPPFADQGVRGERSADDDFQDTAFQRLVAEQRRELERREGLYRHGLPPLQLRGKAVILVDDGLATGATMIAAIRAARRAQASSIIAAAPVSSPEAAARVTAEADEAVILQTPASLCAVGEWYRSFDQLDDEEVLRLLEPVNATAAGG
ncbi:MAG TPA: phosphoribosyltransferase family protein [Steroidobacteraceae bacterium]|nr:phosphoribosyltransferase family protein [Steroidobacteraceae bacterium]